MHHYQFHINDFNASTRHLSHIERALYRDLIDMYYSTEKPITADLPRLERVLLVKTDDEKQALQNVLADFFVVKKLKGDAEPCYHNARIDREIKNYKHRQTPSNKNQTPSNTTSNDHQTPSNDHQTDGNRQTTYKNKVAFLVKSLKDKGVKANARMKIADLQTLFDTHCKQTSNDRQTSSNPSNDHQTAFEQSITINHKPITNNQLINKPPKAPLGDTTAKTGKTDQHNQASQDIFDFWLDIMDKDPAKWKLTDERKRKIIARLKDGKDITDIKQAIYNASQDNWAVAHGKTDISYICQSDARLSEFLLKQPKAMQHRHQQNQQHRQQNQFTGANHATHQPTNKQPTTAEYADKLNTALSQYLEQRKRTQRPANHGDWSAICPVETVV